MKTKYDTYNRWASLFVVTCETLITGGLFWSGLSCGINNLNSDSFVYTTT